jgi:outer membrane protein assembly factor BamB
MTARSYDPESGELLWELQLNGRRSIPGPVANRDHLYLGNVEHRTRPGTFFAVKAGAKWDITPDTISRTSDGIAWYYDDIATGNPSPLLHEGLLYLLSSRGGGLICLDAGTGEIVYEEKLEGMGASWASPWVHGDKIFLPDEKGVTKVIRAGRDFEILHENSLDDRFWASMATAGDAYIFKGDKKLFCIKK